MKRTAAIILALLAGLAPMLAQGEARAFDPRFRTIKVTNPDDFFALPVVTLGDPDSRILISFDELADDRSYLRYRLVHCNADWQPSQLADSEFVEAFNIGDVDDFGYSSNTFIRYVNYHLELPNEDVTPTVSGNYLVEIFDEGDPDTVLLQVPFMVEEPTAAISGAYSGITDRGVNDTWQQLRLTVSLKERSVQDPFSDLFMVVDRNGEPETRRRIQAPLRVASNTLYYEHLPALIFPAGNEYRRFETVRADYPGLHTDSVRYLSPLYHAYLSEDRQRVSASYLYDQTQNGRFLVREHNSSDSDLGADYVMVHFTLRAPEFMAADVYVDGEFTGGLLTDANRMTYDAAEGVYRLEMPLKQGSYNYRYVARARTGAALATPSPIEGDKYETRNEYHIYLYHRPPGARYDRLIGTKNISVNAAN